MSADQLVTQLIRCERLDFELVANVFTLSLSADGNHIVVVPLHLELDVELWSQERLNVPEHDNITGPDDLDRILNGLMIDAEHDFRSRVKKFQCDVRVHASDLRVLHFELFKRAFVSIVQLSLADDAEYVTALELLLLDIFEFEPLKLATEARADLLQV